MRTLVLLQVLAVVSFGCSQGTHIPQQVYPHAVIKRVDIPAPHPSVVITNPVGFQDLEYFFPHLENEQESDLAGAWEAKFEIVFHYRENRQITVRTSNNDRYWSTGKGDKTLRTGLSAFLDPLFQ